MHFRRTQNLPFDRFPSRLMTSEASRATTKLQIKQQTVITNAHGAAATKVRPFKKF